jgi:WD40 repeat protein
VRCITTSAVLSGGKVLVAAVRSGHSIVTLWDIDSRAPASTPAVDHGAAVQSAAFGPGSAGTPGLPAMLATGGLDGVVRLWSVEGGGAWGTPLMAHTAAVSSLAFSSPLLGGDHRMYLASSSYDKTVRVWDVGAGRPVTQVGEPLVGHLDAVECVAFGPVADNWWVGLRAESEVLRSKFVGQSGPGPICLYSTPPPPPPPPVHIVCPQTRGVSGY